MTLPIPYSRCSLPTPFLPCLPPVPPLTIRSQNISATCSAGLVGLLGSDAGSCLQVSKLVAVLSSTGSVVTPVGGYLTGLCNSTTPKCSNETLQQAQATITSNCSADLTSLGGLLSFVNAVVSNYDDVYAAACSKNST